MSSPLLSTESARHFVAVAQTRSFSRAALALGTTQSNVSAHMDQLEAKTGVVLLRRHNRGVSLTSAGESLLPGCRDLLRVAAQAMAAIQQNVYGRPLLRIGAFHTATASLVPRLLSGFMRENRGVCLTVRSGTSEEVKALLIEEEVDCAFLAGAAADGAMTLHARFNEPLGWVTKTGTLKQGGPAQLTVLAELPIYSVRRGLLYEASVRQLFQDAGVLPAMPLFHEAGSTEILREMLAVGACFTLASRSVFEKDIQAGVLEFHAVLGAPPRLQPVLVSKRGRVLEEVPAGFVRFARGQVR